MHVLYTLVADSVSRYYAVAHRIALAKVNVALNTTTRLPIHRNYVIVTSTMVVTLVRKNYVLEK